MPLYDYICPSCGTELNSMLYKIDHEVPKCPLCGQLMKKNYKSMLPNFQYEENDSIDYNLTGHPIVYHSKRGLKEIAKRHGCELRD